VLVRTREQASLTRLFANWWRDARQRFGTLGAFRRLAAQLAEFARDSTPQRQRARFGDMDYDWEQRVNTTAARLTFATRLRGLFSSRYQATEPELFREMMRAVPADLREFTFVDLGSGKGRTLLMAAEFGFRRIIGVELLPELHAAAAENIARHPIASRMQVICADAAEFQFPQEPTVLYLFNPFLESVLAAVLASIEQSLHDIPRPFYVVYHNPLLEHVVAASAVLQRIAGTHQYAVYSAKQ
jgi:SAM-dependent methyltransferase